MSKFPAYTNKHNLPAEVVAAITKDRYTRDDEAPSDFTASSLVAPIQITTLTKRHPNNLRVMDLVDEFWAFLGSIAHTVLEESWHESMGSKVEERLYMALNHKTISGKMDCYHNSMIRDYKSTKVYKIMRADYTDWEIQLNIYAEICRENGWPVEELKIIALLFDWKEGETYKQGYPKAPILTIPIRLWEPAEIKAWMAKRTAALVEAANLNDVELSERYPCSEHERWADFRDWALIKPDADRAYRTFETEEEARAFMAEKNTGSTYELVRRCDPPKRCMKWCKAAPVCQQWANDTVHNKPAAEDTPTIF